MDDYVTAVINDPVPGPLFWPAMAVTVLAGVVLIALIVGVLVHTIRQARDQRVVERMRVASAQAAQVKHLNLH